jgi:two-component system response regulator YesN
MIKLLLVDDESIIRESLETMLPIEALGIRLTGSCGNAFDALNSMQNDMPDILITDIKMPGMDGLELIERAQMLNPKLECIVLSGFDEFTFAKRAISLGVREYLLKPFYKEELIQTLEKMCVKIRQSRRKRDERIPELAEKLFALQPEENAQEITAAQVRDAAFSIGCEDVLREAYTYLIAHQESQPLRGFTAIRRTYDSETELLETVAQGLTAMMARHGQYRAFVNAMCHYIDEHYSDANLSLQYLADNVIHMRADYIGREFTKDTGMKISDYLCRVRMEHAKTLLLDASSENHVYEIAEKIGLGHNPQYFSRLFRKYTGVTPKEFIQNHKK